MVQEKDLSTTRTIVVKDLNMDQVHKDLETMVFQLRDQLHFHQNLVQDQLDLKH